MLKLDDANPIVIKAKKKLEEVEQAERFPITVEEYKNKNIKIFYLANWVQPNSYSDTAKIPNRIIKIYRFVIGAHKRNLGPGDFVIVEEWLPRVGGQPNQYCSVDQLMTRKEARREWKKRLAWSPPDGRQGSCVQLSVALVPNWVKPFNEERPAF